MEVSLRQERNDGRENIHVSTVDSSVIELRPTDLISNDGQEDEPCDHFSIREHVAEVRKRDPSVSSLFRMLCGEQSDELGSLLPPLSVTKFKRWNCKSCMHKVNASAETTDGFYTQQQHKENPVGGLGDENIHIYNICSWPLYSGNKGFTCSVTGPSLEGFHVSLASHIHIGVLNHSNGKPTSVAAKNETCQILGRGKRCKDPTQRIPKTSFLEEFVRPRAEKTKEISAIIVGDQTSKSKEGDTSTRSVKFPECTAIDEKHVEQFGVSEERSHQWKARKVRLLTDIIGAEESGKPGKVRMFGPDIDADQSVDSASRLGQVPKRKDRHLIHTITCKPSDVKPRHVKSENKIKALESVDDGSSLVHWLKKASKKARNHKKEGSGGHIDSEIACSKPVTDTCIGKEMELCLKQYGREERMQKAIVPRRQNMEHLACLVSKNEISANRKRYTNRRSHHAGAHIQRNVHKKNLSMNNKKVHRDGMEESSLIHFLKVPKRSRKKQRIERNCEKKSVDDIPTSIVELLEKSQQERHLTSDKVAFDPTNARIKKIKFVKDGFALNVAEGRRNKKSAEQEPGRSHEQSDVSNGAKHNEKRQTSDRSFVTGIRDIDLNKDDPTSAASSSVLLCNVPFNPKIQKADLGIGHTKPFLDDCSVQLAETVGFGTCAVKLANHSEISNQAGTPPPLSYIRSAGNAYPSGMLEASCLYTNETIPAMHLLSLMDSSTCSGSSLYGTSYRVAVESTVWDQQERNQCKPYRPLPRVGVFGSLLQKEINSHSYNCGTHSGYRIGHSDRLTDGYDHQHSHSIAHSGISSKGKAFQSMTRCSAMDVCSTNRNPAEFTVIGEENEYMVRNWNVPNGKKGANAKGKYKNLLKN